MAPDLLDDIKALEEDLLAFGEVHAERYVFSGVVAPPDRELGPPIAQQVQERELLGHPQRVLDR
jgi:hypothetical protein